MPIDLSELHNLELPKLTEIEQRYCEGILTEGEILSVLKPCKNNTSPGMDDFPSEFYKFFWTYIKQYLVQALNYNFYITTRRLNYIITKNGKRHTPY